MPSADTLILDGSSLSLEDVVRVARSAPGEITVALSERARAATTDLRRYIEDHWLTDEAPAIYAVNTGVGRLKDVRVAAADLERFQFLIINAHAAGVGEPLAAEEVRALLVLRVNALAKGCSGLRVECLDRMLWMLNRGVHPVIPAQGSVGASGDLAPCAHLVAAMIGHPQAEAFYQEERLPARVALERAGLSPTFELKPKDAVALINGSTLSLADAVLGLNDAEVLARTADISASLSLEAMRGELGAFDDRIHQVRNSPNQIDVAANVRRLTLGSERTTEAARAELLPDESRPGGQYQPRIQDAYSLRCTPQVHGAARDILATARRLLEREANAATDNPLVFPDGNGGFEVVSGGNFHGEPVAFAADLITIAVAEIGSISERRCYRLTDSAMSFGLPLNLVGGTLGLNTGMSLVHCSAAALASENKVLCFPSSVDSLPTKANQEDHVSMSTHGSRKMRRVVANAQAIVGIELLCAAQGVDLAARTLSHSALGVGTGPAWTLLRQHVPVTEEDELQSPNITAATKLVASGALLSSVEKLIGALA